MKIGSLDGSGRIETEGPKSPGTSEVFSSEFRDVYQKEVDAAERGAGDGTLPLRMKGESVAVAPVSSVNPADFAEGAGGARHPEVEHLEGILTDLGTRLESRLAIPKVIEDSLETLALESEKLGSLGGRMPVDPSLTQLGQDLSVLSYVESIKWRRGDFV
jgi:hypothetical protein